MLAVGANLLSALLAMSGIVVYMVLHSLAKTSAPKKTVIGGAAGAIPPLWAGLRVLGL